MITPKTLYIIVPCYNEEAMLPTTFPVLRKTLADLIKGEKVSQNSRVVYIDDGSHDATWQLIQQQSKQDELCQGLKFSKNFGHQYAVLAGLLENVDQADLFISIDADLQDDVRAIGEMVAAHGEGHEVVCGVRKSRASDSFFKRNTAIFFYKSLQKVGIKLVHNHADFRLLSKKVVQALANFKESNLFLRGLIPLLGFSTGYVYYDRKPREKGESKYHLKDMLKLAWNGITSFSIMPIKFVRNLGILAVLIGFIYLLEILRDRLFGKTVAGWTSQIMSIWFIGGLNLLSLSIIGEYIGKIYLEVKKRPRYIIETDTRRPLEKEASQSLRRSA